MIKNADELIKLIKENKEYKFKIKVSPGASIESLDFLEDFIKVRIKARPIEGKANRAVIEYLSKILKVNKSSVSILSGKTASIKIVQVKL